MDGCQILLSAGEINLLMSETEGEGKSLRRERVVFSALCVFVRVILTDGALIYLSAIRYVAEINHGNRGWSRTHHV